MQTNFEWACAPSSVSDAETGSVVNVATASGTSPDQDKPNVPVTPGEDIDFFLEKRFYKITSNDEVTVSVPDGAAYMMVYAGTNTTPVIDRITVLSFDLDHFPCIYK